MIMFFLTPFLLGSAAKIGCGLGISELLMGAAATKAVVDVADQMLEDAREEGYIKASKEYEEKFGRQVSVFQKRIKDLESNKQEYLALINDMEKEIRRLEQEIERLTQNNNNEKAQFVKMKKEFTQQGLSELRKLA